MVPNYAKGYLIGDVASVCSPLLIAQTEPFTANQWRDKIDSWLALCPDAPVHSLKELVAFNEAHSAQAMPEGK